VYLLPRNKHPKIIFTQLPFRFYNLELSKQKSNIPLAAGYLKAMAHKEGLLEYVDIEIFDPLTADVTSDSMLLETLLSKRADMICFSLYLWNLFRSLYVIKKIKKYLSNSIIVIGGPEVTKELNYISPQGVDFSVAGEGEMPFVQLVKYLLGGKPHLRSIGNLIFKEGDKIICNPELGVVDDINEIPSPYLTGCLDPRPYRRYWLETMRWCPYRCKYCLYPYRSRARNPFYSLERIEEELNYAKKLGIRYVDIHDSAFNLNPKFKEICRIIQKINKNKSFYLNIFLQAELLNEEDVELLAGLNISTAEIGLQSINQETLSKIGRNINLEQWLDGINLLRRAGINIMIDIMIGLPGEDLRSILKTIEFLKKNRLDAYSIPPTLSVGPSTAIYREAKELGIIKFQSHPPYFILETDRMSFSDIRKANHLSKFHLTRKLSRDSIFSPYCDARLPFLYTYCWAKYPHRLEERINSKAERYPNGIPITKIVIDLNQQKQDINYFKELGKRLSNKIANNLIIWFQIDHPTEQFFNSVKELLKYLSIPNPYNIWNIIFEVCMPFSIKEEREVNQSIYYFPNNLDYRNVYIKSELDGKEFYRVSIKLFYILPPLSNLNSNKIAPRVGENRKVFRTLYIDSDTNPQKVIHGFCAGKDEGILVDFEPGIKSQKIFDSLSLLRENMNERSCIRFKNLLFQKLWYKFFNKYAIRSIINDDLILHIDINKNEKFLYLSHKRIMLDMTEFILSLKNLPRK